MHLCTPHISLYSSAAEFRICLLQGVMLYVQQQGHCHDPTKPINAPHGQASPRRRMFATKPPLKRFPSPPSLSQLPLQFVPANSPSEHTTQLATVLALYSNKKSLKTSTCAREAKSVPGECVATGLAQTWADGAACMRHPN